MSKKYRVDTDKGSFIVETDEPAASGPAPDPRSWDRVASDQLINAGKGFGSGLLAIPGALKEGAGIAYDAATGNEHSALDRLKNAASGLYHSYVDPIATSVRGAGALAESHGMLPPGSVTAPSQQDWEKAAQDAGAQAGAIVGEKLISKIPTSAEGIQGVANKLRSIKAAQAPAGVPLTMTQAAGTAIRGAVGAAAEPVASVVERLAKARASMDTPPVVADNPGAPVREVAPSADVQQLQHVGTPAGPDMEMRQPSESTGAIDTSSSPELQQLQQRMSQPVAHPDAGTATPRDIQMAREAVLQNGASRSTANLLKVSRNVPELLKTAPELRGVPPGPNFNTKLYSAFNRIGHELNATEASIPDNTMVPTENAVSQLKTLEAKYLDTNQPGAVRAIDKVKSFLAERPSMQWSDFIKAKRAFFNEISLSSAAGREAYQIFKKLSNDVSPELGDLNQKYYTVKSAMENAAMDIKTGEKIRTIGKAQKPVEAESGKGMLRMPL